ncbi:hypothetical protein SDC9_197734 [bioreactor metagenome]|uniref:Uncharacterized protein n=1 Tax=bioreactor metagenome TaxID=1076179 RepID=A0A645IFM7_9ZZZZ
MYGLFIKQLRRAVVNDAARRDTNDPACVFDGHVDLVQVQNDRDIHGFIDIEEVIHDDL